MITTGAIVENALCECLHWHFGKQQLYNTVKRGQLIYHFDDHKLVGFNSNRDETGIKLLKWNTTSKGKWVGLGWRVEEFDASNVTSLVVLTRN